jgi:hypothetical protein
VGTFGNFLPRNVGVALKPQRECKLQIANCKMLKNLKARERKVQAQLKKWDTDLHRLSQIKPSLSQKSRHSGESRPPQADRTA